MLDMTKNVLIIISAVCIILSFLFLSVVSLAQVSPVLAPSVQTSSVQTDMLSFEADQKIEFRLEEFLAEDADGRARGGKIPVIVMLNADALSSPDRLFSDDLSANKDFSVKYRFNLIPALAGEASSKAIKDMAESNLVSGIYFDGSTQISSNESTVAPSTEGSATQDGNNDGYISPARIIKADKLWEKGINGTGITVAVIDSGIDKNHPDLIGKVVAEKNFLADEITADDLLGHGTMVAGIIAGSGAASNGSYRGIAPGAKLISVKVIDGKGDGKVSDIIAGIEWAVYNGADILSLSLGGINLGETNPPITMAADNAAREGVVVCVAAGNRNSSDTGGQVSKTSSSQTGGIQAGKSRSPVELSQSDGSDGSRKDVYYLLIPVVLALPPGLIDSPGDGVKVITVGATDSSGRIASFSGSGPTRDDRIKPDVVAPGVDIISIVPTGIKRPSPVGYYYSSESGTSLSAPVAAGLAALLLQADRNLTAAGVKAAMTRGAKKLDSTLGESYEEFYQGAGMLDALSSYELLANGSNICGTIPDSWTAGRWAYLPAGKGVYVGLDTGADRPQKKIYALAPGDEDWSLRFVFFSDRAIRDLKTSVLGEVADWVSLQPLPRTLAANDQKVFAASIAVPQDTTPGIHNGTIEIADGSEKLLDIPISVNVALPLNISQGEANITGSLNGSQWRYYYLVINPGTTEFEAALGWQQDTKLDLFLLSPTSEYYTGEGAGNDTSIAAFSKINASRINSSEAAVQKSSKKVTGPSSGTWLIAVHSENATRLANYTLQVERSQLETDPLRWNLVSVAAGTSNKTQFYIKNLGLPLQNLSYTGMIENTIIRKYEGRVGYKDTWNRTVKVTGSTKKISAELISLDGNNTSEVALVFENPRGTASEENADLGTDNLGPLEISNPELGNWTVKVYGYNVPQDGKLFAVSVKEYAEENWSWIAASGPDQLESECNGTMQATLTIPEEASVPRVDGYIKISSDRHTFEIPVSVTIAGTRLTGLSDERDVDTDGDGLIDVLSLGFGVNISAPGEFRLNGMMVDCSGNWIGSIDRSFALQDSGTVLVNASGIDIWRYAKCGPLRIQNLILYDGEGSYIDRFDRDIIIDRKPGEFQSPAAYLSGEFSNRTTSSAIAVGVNVTVIKPGRYELQGVILDDAGDRIGEARAEGDLVAGNTTMLLQFNPDSFVAQGEVSAVHLADLVLSRNNSLLERKGDAWSSDKMDPQALEAEAAESSISGIPVVKLGGDDGVKL
jgi:serine protease AprX